MTTSKISWPVEIAKADACTAWTACNNNLIAKGLVSQSPAGCVCTSSSMSPSPSPESTPDTSPTPSPTSAPIPTWLLRQRPRRHQHRTPLRHRLPHLRLLRLPPLPYQFRHRRRCQHPGRYQRRRMRLSRLQTSLPTPVLTRPLSRPHLLPFPAHTFSRLAHACACFAHPCSYSQASSTPPHLWHLRPS